jgi:hypothetical protein
MCKHLNVIEIFKTNVNSKRQANRVLKSLYTHLPAYFVNFDLDDCDRILRVQSKNLPVDTIKVIQIVKDHSVEINLLED